jgi:hypothetical protein
MPQWPWTQAARVAGDAVWTSAEVIEVDDLDGLLSLPGGGSADLGDLDGAGELDPSGGGDDLDGAGDPTAVTGAGEAVGGHLTPRQRLIGPAFSGQLQIGLSTLLCCCSGTRQGLGIVG